VLIDVGILHHFVFEADHGEFVDEIVSGISELVPAKTIIIDWEALAEMDDDEEIEKVFAKLAKKAKKSDEVLVILDKGSDSFPLAFLPSKLVAQAQKLAATAGEVDVDIVGRS
jgi:hypothetical protein